MDSIFFWVSKLLWPLVSPLNFIFLLIVLAWVLLMLGKSRLLKPLSTLIVVLLLLIAVFPLGSWLLRPLERHFRTNPELPAELEGIIVLSGSLDPRSSRLWDQVQVNGAVDRDLAFIRLARQYPRAQLVYTGGSSSLLDQRDRAADVARRLLTEQGFDTDRVLFERDSRNTWENAKFSLELVKPGLSGPWVLITSAFHMPRAVGIFCKTGWPVIPYPVDHYSSPALHFSPRFKLAGHIGQLDLAVHEWLGLIAYRLTGKTDALLSPGCRNADTDQASRENSTTAPPEP